MCTVKFVEYQVFVNEYTVYECINITLGLHNYVILEIQGSWASMLQWNIVSALHMRLDSQAVVALVNKIV